MTIHTVIVVLIFFMIAIGLAEFTHRAFVRRIREIEEGA